MNAKHVNIIFARYVITVIYTRLYALLYFLLRRSRVIVASAERKMREVSSVIFFNSIGCSKTSRRFNGENEITDRYELRESLKEHRVSIKISRVIYILSDDETSNEDSCIGYPLNVSATPRRKDDRNRRSRRKSIFLSRVCDAEKSWAQSLGYVTETGVAHCKHGKSINNFRIVFLQSATGIQMRPPSRAKYVDIMDINIFIYDTPGCRGGWEEGGGTAPINHVAVILITFRIESVYFRCYTSEKVQICMQRSP